MMRLIVALFFPMLISTPLVFAAGTITLEGKVRNFSKDTIELSDGRKIFVIDRRKMGTIPSAGQLKSGQKLTLHVPFTAINKVKNVK